MVFRRVGGIDARDARVEPASEDRRETRPLEALLIGPLPAVLVFGLVERLVVGRVEVADAIFQARVHDVQVLIGESEVHDQFRLESLEQGDQLRYVVRIDSLRPYACILDIGRDLVALALRAARQQDVREHVGVHRHFLYGDGTYASRADH